MVALPRQGQSNSWLPPVSGRLAERAARPVLRAQPARLCGAEDPEEHFPHVRLAARLLEPLHGLRKVLLNVLHSLCGHLQRGAKSIQVLGYTLVADPKDVKTLTR